MIASLLGFVLFTLIVSAWSQRRGTGFWFAFFWSVLLSPIIGALFVLLRRPRARALVLGGIDEPLADPRTPRPMFCAVMIIAIVLLIVVMAGR